MSVASWITRVTTAGGTVSSGHQQAAQNFLDALDNASITAKVLRCNLFAGDQLAAAIVPLITTLGPDADANTGFVGGDYDAATGLTGGTGRLLDTGVSPNDVVAAGASGGFGFWARTSPASGATRIFGGLQDGTSNRYRVAYSSTDNTQVCWGKDSNVAGNLLTVAGRSAGFWYGQRTAGGNLELYKDGVSQATPTAVGVGVGSAVTWYVFNWHGGTSAGYTGTSGGYALTSALTATEATALYTAFNAFNTERATANHTTAAWQGNLSATGASVVARLRDSGSARLAYSVNSDLSSPAYSGTVTADATNQVCRFDLTGLTANTTYYWQVEVGGTLDAARPGTFHTPASGAYSFTWAGASCAGRDRGAASGTTNYKMSNHAIFDLIRTQLTPLMFTNFGDMHYRDISTNVPDSFRQAYKDLFAQDKQELLYRSVAFDYVWDDHDFGGDNSGSTTASKPAAQTVYREFVPHYTLPAGSGSNPIYHTYVIGRVRFIVTDLRSGMTADTKMGATQLSWFETALLAFKTARTAGTEAVCVWVSSIPWISDVTDTDSWGDGTNDERGTIASFLESNDLTRSLVIVNGDGHNVGLDDGTNSQYAAGAVTPGPIVCQFAPLDVGTNSKGGPYSSGSFANANQVGTLAFVDSGGSVTLTAKGWNYSGGALVQLATVTKTFSTPTPTPTSTGLSPGVLPMMFD